MSGGTQVRCLVAAAVLMWTAVAAAAETIKVDIDKVAYAPAAISAHVGDTIAWTNKDIVAHTATARDKQWDLMIMPGKTQSVVVKRAGTIEIYCRFHPNMVGRLTVAE